MQALPATPLAASETGGPVPHADEAAFAAWLSRRQAEVDNALAEHLKAVAGNMGPHSRLPAAVQYSVQVGGKRLRPILVLECCQVCGGATASALPAALAVELVHTFSLVHDDLPAMDNDDLRRGRATNHKVFGEAVAILAGDWLVTHAFALLTDVPADDAVFRSLVHTLARGTQWMIEGQGADIAGEGQAPSGELVEYVHLHKTAALIETCCRLGAACARAPEDVAAALARYGRHLGLAFQITDDLLDETGTTQQLGKRVGKDAVVAKQTYPAAFGLAASQAQAEREIEAALAALEPFGGRAAQLRALAQFVLRRDR